jgi:hypothetical protein
MIRPGSRICSNCGARLDTGTPSPRSGRREASVRDERGGPDRQWGVRAPRDRSPTDAGGRYGSYDRRNTPYDRRRPQPETHDEWRGPRSTSDGVRYRPNPARDQSGGHGQNGRRDRAERRSWTGQESPALQPRTPAWAAQRRRGGTATSTSSMLSSRLNLTIFVVVAGILVLSIGAVAALGGTSLLSRIRGGSATSDSAPPFVAYTPGPTPAPSSGYKEFDSPHSLYVLDYPQSWSTSSTSTGAGGNSDYVDEFNQTSPVASFIVEEAGAFSSLTRSDIIQAEVRGANGGGRTFTQISNPITTVEIAGEQWLRADYLITETDGTKFHMAILACHHSQRGYALVLLGPPNTFSQDTSAVFEPILNSFHFTG